MNLIDLIQDKLWAIVPEKLEAVHQVLYNRMHNVKMDLSKYETRAREAQKETDYTRMEGDIAVINMEGVLAKRMNLFMAMSGGSSTELLMRDYRAAMEDPDVRGILLDVDSPGGTVDGTEALAELIYESRGEKPVVAFANGLMASAAYWIGSAADMVITEETGEVGSIGVYQMHYDYSKADEKAGLKRTLIKAGKYKAAGNDAEPLSREMMDYLEEGVDYIYSLFVESVARYRGASVETVLKHMADGRIFIGSQAMEAGLVDRLSNFEAAMDAVRDMAKNHRIFGSRWGAIVPQAKRKENLIMPKTTKPEAATLSVDVLSAEYPDLVEEIRNEGAASVDVETPRQAGADSERERILGLAGIQFGEDEAGKFRAIVESGVSVEQFEAVRAVTPQGAVTPEKPDKMGEMLKAVQEAGAENPGSGVAADGPRNFTEAWTAIKREMGCSTVDAMRRAVKAYPDLHKAFLSQPVQGGKA